MQFLSKLAEIKSVWILKGIQTIINKNDVN